MYIEAVSISLGRDPFSMGSHLLGAVLSLIATVYLLRRARRNGLRGLGVGIYGLSMTLAFGASALFHYVDPASARYELFNKLDHAAIFLMIAGTGTAIYGSLQTVWSRRLTGLLWAFTGLGIVLKLTLWPMQPWLTASIYLTLGWLGSMGLVMIGRTIGWQWIQLFVLGGIAYSVGAIIFAVNWPVLWPGVIGAHEVFHILVLLGAGLHFGFIYRYCTRPCSFCEIAPSETDITALQLPLVYRLFRTKKN